MTLRTLFKTMYLNCSPSSHRGRRGSWLIDDFHCLLTDYRIEQAGSSNVSRVTLKSLLLPDSVICQKRAETISQPTYPFSQLGPSLVGDAYLNKMPCGRSLRNSSCATRRFLERPRLIRARYVSGSCVERRVYTSSFGIWCADNRRSDMIIKRRHVTGGSRHPASSPRSRISWVICPGSCRE